MFVLAIDIGSTRLKAALLDRSGGILALAQRESPLLATPLRPDDILLAAAAIAREVCNGTRPDAIAVTGATRTTVLVGENGQAIGPAIPLSDGRGSAQAPLLQAAYAAQAPDGLGAFHPLARVLDVRESDPATYQHMRQALDLKDWVNLQLTGQPQVDTVAWARILPDDRDMDALLARLQLPPGMMGAPCEPARTVGVVRETAPQAWHWCLGVPVVQCGFDAWCASFGMGSVQVNAVYNVCGTTDVFGGFSRAHKTLDGIACLPWAEDIQHLGGPCLTGLSTLAWFGNRFLNDADPAAVIACAANAGDDCPIALPFTHGERMPFWRPELRARFLDVGDLHGTAEFARALIDGLLVFQRWLIAKLSTAPTAVYLGGGGSALAHWPQAKASAFGVPVRIAHSEEPALLGAAMCAQVALGRFESLTESQGALCPGYREVAPDPNLTRRLRAIEPRFLAHLNRMLAE
jgi:xylulokinase